MSKKETKKETTTKEVKETVEVEKQAKPKNTKKATPKPAKKAKATKKSAGYWYRGSNDRTKISEKDLKELLTVRVNSGYAKRTMERAKRIGKPYADPAIGYFGYEEGK